MYNETSIEVSLFSFPEPSAVNADTVKRNAHTSIPTPSLPCLHPAYCWFLILPFLHPCSWFCTCITCSILKIKTSVHLQHLTLYAIILCTCLYVIPECLLTLLSDRHHQTFLESFQMSKTDHFQTMDPCEGTTMPCIGRSIDYVHGYLDVLCN